MAKKKGFDYFEALEQLAKKTEQAGAHLLNIVQDYDATTLKEKGNVIHELEREGDELVHEIMNQLNHSFITPLDREDIALITELIDDVLDGINSIPYQFDNYLIQGMRPQTEKMVGCIVDITEALSVVASEFSKFKHSKMLGDMIIRVNAIESKADKLYSELIKDLFSNETDVLTIIKWKDIYKKLEDVVNLAEDAVDSLSSMVLKNT